MAIHLTRPGTAPTATDPAHDPARQAYLLLRTVFTVAVALARLAVRYDAPAAR